jgi:hypothetical protein
LSVVLRVFILFFFLSTVVFGSNFRESFKITLKKDEPKKILVKYNYDTERIYKFRWTLYKNGGLVLFYSYDGVVYQNILFQNHKNQSFTTILRHDSKNHYRPPYLLLKFKDFDIKKDVAKFELYLYDPEVEVRLKLLKNKN